MKYFQSVNMEQIISPTWNRFLIIQLSQFQSILNEMNQRGFFFPKTEPYLKWKFINRHFQTRDMGGVIARSLSLKHASAGPAISLHTTEYYHSFVTDTASARRLTQAGFAFHVTTHTKEECTRWFWTFNRY